MWSTGVPKATRSPGRASASPATGRPARAWSAATRGRLTPRSPYTFWTSPEQSSPVAGSVPPHTYGTPRYRREAATTSSPVAAPEAEPVADVGDVPAAGSETPGSDDAGAATSPVAAVLACCDRVDANVVP